MRRIQDTRHATAAGPMDASLTSLPKTLPEGKPLLSVGQAGGAAHVIRGVSEVRWKARPGKPEARALGQVATRSPQAPRQRRGPQAGGLPWSLDIFWVAKWCT